MKLDNKVKEDYIIFSCFGTEQAKQYVDTMGYFTDDISDFNNLDDCYYDTLNRVDDNSSRPFFNKYLSKYFTFFLPEKFIKQRQAKKKYRPYTLEEFNDKFTIGQPFFFRRKGDLLELYLVRDGYEDRKQGDKKVHFIGGEAYTLDELFNEYEWQEYCAEDYKPFGVEE